MKKLFIFILIIISSCSKKEFSPSFYVGHEFSLENGARALIKTPTDGGVSANGFNIQVVEISDIRCPEDLECIWGGNAKVNLQIGNDSIKLCIGSCGPNESSEANFNYKRKSYKIILRDVLPHPKSNHTAGIEKSAVLVTQSL